jgi:hypothetical protein
MRKDLAMMKQETVAAAMHAAAPCPPELKQRM